MSAPEAKILALGAVETMKPQRQTPGPSILTSAEFVNGLSPPDYLVFGILQRGFLYSLTGPTGAGKTAIAQRLLATTAMGRPIGTRDVEQGRCLMLAGENPDDVRARWIALSEQMGFVAGEIDVHFLPGVFPIPLLLPIVRERAEKLGGLALIVVDTGAAFFSGAEENDNKEMGDYARSLRLLTDLPGRPCVLVNCHPVKNAGADNLIPRGGGAFIAEVDGNLCCRKTDTTVELHQQGKFRGPDFEPIPFELVTVHSDRLKDSKGRAMPTVIARPLSEFEHACWSDANERELERLLIAMEATPGASTSQLATALGWVGKGGDPLKSKVCRLQKVLKGQRLVTDQLGKSVLTQAGEKAAKQRKLP